MEDLVRVVNEKFLEAILETQNSTRLGMLTSAYLDFAHAAQVMQSMELEDFDEWDGEDL